MNIEQFNSLLSIVIIPEVISLIMEKDKLSETEAINTFYKSKVYEFLSNEETKVWHYSPLTLYMMWKEEQNSGEVIFPDEGLII